MAAAATTPAAERKQAMRIVASCVCACRKGREVEGERSATWRIWSLPSDGRGPEHALILVALFRLCDRFGDGTGRGRRQGWRRGCLAWPGPSRAGGQMEARGWKKNKGRVELAMVTRQVGRMGARAGEEEDFNKEVTVEEEVVEMDGVEASSRPRSSWRRRIGVNTTRARERDGEDEGVTDDSIPGDREGCRQGYSQVAWSKQAHDEWMEVQSSPSSGINAVGLVEDFSRACSTSTRTSYSCSQWCGSGWCMGLRLWLPRGARVFALDGHGKGYSLGLIRVRVRCASGDVDWTMACPLLAWLACCPALPLLSHQYRDQTSGMRRGRQLDSPAWS